MVYISLCVGFTQTLQANKYVKLFISARIRPSIEVGVKFVSIQIAGVAASCSTQEVESSVLLSAKA